MSNQKCSKCKKTLDIKEFDQKHDGELLKTCNSCRTYKKQYCERNKEQLTEYGKEYREKQMGAFLPCNICGAIFRQTTIPHHQRMYSCQPKGTGKPRIDYCTWLFKNETTLLPHDLKQLECIRLGTKKAIRDTLNSWLISIEAYERYKDTYEERDNEYHKYFILKPKQ